MWSCVCACGETATVGAQAMRTGNTSSCGCLRREVTGAARRAHGKTASRAYNSWAHMLQRCNNPAAHRWPLYGGRGITVCEKWKSFEGFFEDMGDPPEGMSLDRIDVNGNYEPSNCRWATQKEQTRNMRRTRYVQIGGETKPLAEWCERLGVPYSMARDRLNRGWLPERALTEPRK